MRNHRDGLAELLPPLPQHAAKIAIGDEIELHDIAGTPPGFALALGEVVDVVTVDGVRCAAVRNPSGNTFLAAPIERCRRRPT